MKALLSTLCILLSGVLAFAQNDDPQQYFEQQLLNQLNQLNIIQFSPASTSGNTAQLFQNGNGHDAAIDQVNPTANQGNTALLIQNGNIHTANINMNGAGNTAEAVQEGRDHTYNLDLDGNRINTQVLQQGDGNTINQTLQVDGLDYLIVQQGTDNTITQTENDPNTATGLIIRQQGSGMDLIIRNSNIVP